MRVEGISQSVYVAFTARGGDSAILLKELVAGMLTAFSPRLIPLESAPQPSASFQLR